MWKKKYKAYETKILLYATLFFVIVYGITDAMPIILEISSRFLSVDAKFDYDAIFNLSLMIKWMVPILIFISWYMYIERYIYFRKQYYEVEYYSKGKMTEISPNIEFSIIVQTIVGIITFLQFQNLKYFLAENWNLLDGLLFCIVLKIVFLLGCFVIWIISMMYGICYEIMDRKTQRKVRIGMVIFLSIIFATLVFDVYSSWKEEAVYQQKKSEYYDDSPDEAGLFERTSKNFNVYFE